MIITAFSKGLTNCLMVPQVGYMIWIGSIAIILYNNNNKINNDNNNNNNNNNLIIITILIIIVIIIIITVIVGESIIKNEVQDWLQQNNKMDRFLL